MRALRLLRALGSPLALTLLWLAGPALAQQAAQPAVGAKLPLVTVGTVLRWADASDEILFDLPAESWIRLSIYSPEIDFAETGDERYDTGPLEASFSLSAADGELARQRFSLAPSSWLTLFEGPAQAGRHLLRSEVSGHGKNVYLLSLETERDNVELLGTSVTVNASSSAWEDAFSFEIEGHRPCRLELYDGDGPAELEALLIQPGGYQLPLEVSGELSTTRQHLPRLPGLYTVRLRLPEPRIQLTNSVRFAVVCDGEAQLVTLVPPSQLTAPEPGPIVVEVIDTEGAPLDIPFAISGRYERTVTLADEAGYQLVARRIDGGEELGERGARFGVPGGRVVFVLEREAVALTLPEIRVELAAAIALPRPEVRIALREAIALPRPEIQVELAAATPVPLPDVRIELAAAIALPVPEIRVALREAIALPRPKIRIELAEAVALPRPEIRVALREAIALPVPDVRVRVVERVSIARPQVLLQVAPSRTLARPDPIVSVQLPEPLEPLYLLRREVTPPAALSCEQAIVTVSVENRGAGAGGFTLRERLAPGLTLIRSDGDAQWAEGELVWRDRLAPGETRSYSYQLQLTPEAAARSLLRGVLVPDSGEPLVSEGALERAELTASLEPVEQGIFYAGDERILRLTVHNPLARPLRVSLESLATQRLEILDGPKELDLPAGGSASGELRVRGEAAGEALLRVTPFACDAATPAATPAGAPATARLEIAEPPSLPQPRQLTTVLIDMAAFNLPLLDGLVLVEQLPAGAEYVAGSSAFNGEPLPDPRRAGDALVFDLPGRAVGQLSFTVLHQGALIFDQSHSSLIGLTPEPELLLGRTEALGLLGAAEPAAESPALVRERVGAVILAPAPGLVLRNRDRVTVTSDTPLGADVSLLINGEPISEDTVGRRVLDPNSGRQTFDYVGVALAAGPNELRLESVGPDGEALSDVITIYFAGAPAAFSATPLTPLAADSSDPLQIDLAVSDAWGNATMDDLVTVEVLGALPHLEDASPEQVGYQLRLEGGHALLALEPVAEPGAIVIRVLLGDDFQEQTLTIGSNLRPWIVSGVGSVGASYDPGSGELGFGLGASFFARGRIFDDYLLTLAGNYPLTELGPRDSNPYQTFPVSGSSGNRNFDAVSQHGFYARLERDLSYLQYGDFATGLDGVFLDPGRGYTGLSGEYRGDIVTLRGYGAYVPSDDQVAVDLPSDGTSARFLPDAPIKPGSLRVSVIKLDALGNPIPEDDNDPRTRQLEPLIDFRVDEEVGLLLLFRPVPQFDTEGRPYVLRLNYTLIDGHGAARFAQFGAQLLVNLEPVTLRAGVAQETGSSTSFSRVIAAGASADLGAVQADVEVAYGSDQSSSGLALSTRLRYQQGSVAAEASWQHLASGYRSAQVDSDAGAGHVVGARVSVALSDDLSVALGADLSQRATDAVPSYRADAIASYRGQGFDGQFGVDVDSGDWRALLGGNLYDIGVSGSRFGVIHRQALSGGGNTVTDFSASLPLIANLNLTLTDQLIWGRSNALFLGLEAGFDNNRLLSSVCSALGCLQLDPSVPLGATTVIAQYEIADGFSDQAGRVRLGLDTSLPLSEQLSLQGSVEQNLDLAGAGGNSTVVGLGANYDEQHFDASVRYELRLAQDGTKHVATAASNFAVTGELFGSLGATYVSEPDRSGFGFSVAGAYRGNRLDVLSNNQAEFGALAAAEDNIWGDTRLTWTIDNDVDLRFGYAYRWLLGDSYLDIVSLGSSLHAWQGGELLAHGRLFHDWTGGEFALGASLEASQRFGCGVYGVGGYNLGGLDRDYGAVYGGPGAFIRLDIVFDEQWSCGDGEVDGRVWLDADGDGLQGESEAGVPGARLELYDSEGDLVASGWSGIDGGYRFVRVVPGSYRLVVIAPGGYATDSAVSPAAEPATDTDPDEVGLALEIGFGQRISDFDVGLKPRGGDGE